MTSHMKVENFNTFYGSSQALRNFSCELKGGEVLCLLGRNGAGKTTALQSIMGTVKPASGKLILDGKDLFGLPAKEIPRHGIGYVPQGRRLFSDLTVAENLEVGLKTRNSDPKALDYALELFPVLRERMDQRSGTMSGGEQTMLAMARAMCIEPKVMLMDEPTEGLMPSAIAGIRDAVVKLRDAGVAILLVEQRVDAVLPVANRVAFMDHGEIKAEFDIEDVRNDPSLLHHYVGVSDTAASKSKLKKASKSKPSLKDQKVKPQKKAPKEKALKKKAPAANSEQKASVAAPPLSKATSKPTPVSVPPKPKGKSTKQKEAAMSAKSLKGLSPDREIVSESILDTYDFVVCGGGTAGSIVARRLAEDPNVSVLLLEAGGSDRVPQVIDSTQWMWNIATSRDWGYKAAPSATLNGRAPLLPMGKLLGGGSSINGSVWARGHKNDFDMWAEEAEDDDWNYESILKIYRKIEDWQGTPDKKRRGTGGLLNILQPENPIPLVDGLIQGAEAIGIPYVDDINGAPMEGDGGCGLPNVLVQDGNQRVSMAATYLHPYMGRSNLHILLCAETTKVNIKKGRAASVNFVRRGKEYKVKANKEIILSMGAINTPKVLMLSGVGDEKQLKEHDIDVVQHLPGVGKNFQDHILLAGICWEYIVPEMPRNNAAEFIFYAKSRSDLATPDLMPVLEETPFGSEVTGPQYGLPTAPESAWTLAPGLARPDSRGEVKLASADWKDAPIIEANFLATQTDMNAMLRCVEMCREIGNSEFCEPYRKREIMPGNLPKGEMENFIRDAAGTYFHETCTCKMGTDKMSVVNSKLKVYGVEGLRIADGSIMPAITTGNTMAPCAVIGERASDILRQEYELSDE